MEPSRSKDAEVLGADSDAVESLWQALVHESQHRPLEPWSKGLPPSLDNYSLFGKQHLAFYWALAEAESLTMGHQVTVWPELPFMILSGYLTQQPIKLGVYRALHH